MSTRWLARHGPGGRLDGLAGTAGGHVDPGHRELTIRSVIFDVVLTAPVSKLSIRVAGPSLMNWASGI